MTLAFKLKLACLDQRDVVQQVAPSVCGSILWAAVKGVELSLRFVVANQDQIRDTIVSSKVLSLETSFVLY